MKEQWTQDLKDKLSDYEAPMMPEGLWDDIEKEISPKKTVPFFVRWQRVCAAVALLLVSASGIWFMMNGDGNDTSLAVIDGNPVQNIEESSQLTDANTPSVGGIKSLIASAITTYNVDRKLVADAYASVSSQEETTSDNNSSQDASQPETSQETPHSETVSETPTKTNNENRSMEYYVPENYTSKKKNKDNIYLAVNASGIAASGTNISSGERFDYGIWDSPTDSTETIQASRSKSYIDNVQHHRPISVGMQVGIPLSKRWSLNTGLTYTYLYSEFDKGYQNRYTHTDQKLHYLGVPLMFNYRLYSSRIINLYLGLGSRFDVGVSGTSTAHEIINDNEASVSSERLSGIPCNILPTINSGVQLNIIKGLSIYAEPSLQYNSSTSKKYSTYYTEHNLMFDIHFGVRWDLSK